MGTGWGKENRAGNTRTLIIIATVFAVIASCGCTSRAKQPFEQQGGAQPMQPAGNPQRDPNEGPWNHDLILLESADGLMFKPGRVVIERGGVPSVIRDSSGRLVLVFQWFPYDSREAFDQVAVSFSEDDGGTWTSPEQMKFEGLPEGYMRPFDPTIVQLDDGRYRLYFTSQQPPHRQPAIYSGVSEDAVHYTFEPGVRSAGAEGGVVDCSAVFRRGEWHLYAHEFVPENRDNMHDPSYNERAYHGVSKDGLVFEAHDPIIVPARASWIGNPLIVDDELRFYGSGEGVWPAVSEDGYVWSFREGSRMRAADPAVFIAADGVFRMIATGPMRDDASPPPFRGPLEKKP